MEISLNNSLNKVVTAAEKKVLADEKASLLMEIRQVKNDLQHAYSNFDYFADSLMVDYYTYQIKAYEAKFEFLLKKAKELNVCEI